MTPTAANDNRRLSLKELRARRGENRRRRPIDAEDEWLQQELDDVLAALIWKLKEKPAGGGSGGLIGEGKHGRRCTAFSVDA